MTLRLRRIDQEGLRLIGQEGFRRIGQEVRRNGRENAAASSQVDYIEQELLFIDFTGAASCRHLYNDLYHPLLQ